MDLFKTKFIGYSLMFLGLALLIITILLPISDETILFWVLFVLGVAIELSGNIVFLIFWKCPFCHRHLPWQAGLDFCPYCRSTLDT